MKLLLFLRSILEWSLIRSIVTSLKENFAVYRFLFEVCNATTSSDGQRLIRSSLSFATDRKPRINVSSDFKGYNISIIKN